MRFDERSRNVSKTSWNYFWTINSRSRAPYSSMRLDSGCVNSSRLGAEMNTCLFQSNLFAFQWSPFRNSDSRRTARRTRGASRPCNTSARSRFRRCAAGRSCTSGRRSWRGWNRNSLSATGKRTRNASTARDTVLITRGISMVFFFF